MNVLENVSDKLEQCQTLHIHEIIAYWRDVKINKKAGLNCWINFAWWHDT